MDWKLSSPIVKAEHKQWSIPVGGNGQYLAEVAMQRYTTRRIAQIMLTAQWYQEHFPKYKAGLEDKKAELPASADLLADHRSVVVERGVPKVPEGSKKKGTDGEQRHGDGAIAGCLMWFASEMDGGIIIIPADFGWQIELGEEDDFDFVL